MSRLVSIDYTWYFDKALHAGPKARNDASRTLRSLGYDTVMRFHSEAGGTPKPMWRRHLDWLGMYMTHLRDCRQVVFQWPTLIPQWLLDKLRKQGTRIIYLVHDLDRLREGKHELNDTEKRLLGSADEIIAHTPAMKDYLCEQGMRNDITVLGLFDYYTETIPSAEDPNIRSIVYCGNLGKSRFLNALDDSSWETDTYLYGGGTDGKFTNPCLKYNGVFAADNPTGIKGGWGLVWDGDSAETCDTSSVGNYLCYNLPHKTSLYLAIGKPVIVWKKAAVAPYILEHNAGIAVNSLYEIPEKIAAISKEQYEKMAIEISAISRDLRTGAFLRAALNASLS